MPESVLFASAVTGALLVGVIIGLGVNLVRSPAEDAGAPVVDLQTLGQLSGSWTSGSFTEDDFVGYMTEAGHALGDIASFLQHDPIPGTSAGASTSTGANGSSSSGRSMRLGPGFSATSSTSCFRMVACT